MVIGGKILGKGKVTKDAEDKIRSILNKESNKLLRGLDDKIKDLEMKLGYDSKENILEDMKKNGMDELLFLDDEINQSASKIFNKNQENVPTKNPLVKKIENLINIPVIMHGL